mmetsp:Transcript_115324/g.229849  ORF Transcript_115324/g.229849 Transcript_115324/m.229849 type:complete len:206 (-) Transcript_115324:282-899(-)
MVFTSGPSSVLLTVPVYMRASRSRTAPEEWPATSITFWAPSRIACVESIALSTAEAPCSTAAWACTSSSSSLTLVLLTRMTTSAEAVSAKALSQVATTPSGTAMVLKAAPVDLARISTASSTAFNSSVQSASSLGSWCRSLMDRLAAKRHSKADLPAKLIGFMLSPPRSPPHHRETSHCRGATTCGSAPQRMAKRSNESLDFRSE